MQQQNKQERPMWPRKTSKQEHLATILGVSEMKAKSGFTLVEILIVVVILGILAAIVIPQFTEASTEAKVSSLVSDLQTMRSQIELYKIQHNDLYPGQDAAGGDIAADNFVADLTGYTTVDGAAAAAPGDGVYGPYLQKMPMNQFRNLNTVAATGGDAGWILTTAAGAGQGHIQPHATGLPATVDADAI
jgi:general secretion pathway protein G